jgi:hypothetical protein
LGRFISPDSITPGGPQGLNRYAYVHNSPINFIDPSGNLAVCNPLDQGPECYRTGDGGGGQIDPSTLAAGDKKSAGTPSTPSSGGGIPPVPDPNNGYKTSPPVLTWNNYSNGWTYYNESVSICNNSGAAGLGNWAMGCGYAVSWMAAHVIILAGGGILILAGGGLLCAANPECEQEASQEVSDEGYNSFRALKAAIGDPGEGYVWHHIVEQSQEIKSGFSVQQINSVDNIIAVEKTIHAQISGFYRSNIASPGIELVRNWLAGQSFEAQYEFGIQVLQKFGVIP